jgi:hypothetical protein
MVRIHPPKSTINPSRNIPHEFIIKDTVDMLYHLGLSKNKRGFDVESKRHKLLRYSIGIAEFIYLSRSLLFSCLYLTKNEDQIGTNERFFIILCDYAYFIPEIRIHWNIILSLAFLSATFIHFYHMINKNLDQNWLDLLRCLSAEIKPCEIGLNHIEDIEKILAR